MRVHNTIHTAYLAALYDVYHLFEHTSSPRGQPIREILDYQFRVMNPVAEPIVTHDSERNKVIAEYTAKETELYNSMSNRVEDFAKASKFWEKLANPDGTVNSAYGYLIWKNLSCGNEKFDAEFKTPWEWARSALENDKDTRQAILRFSLPEHSFRGVKDFTCTMYGNFVIRDDRLHFSVHMRSNDLMLGLVYDLPWFVSLMDKMIEDLKPKYPNLTKGYYTHSANSMHIYDRNEAAVLKMLGK